MAAWLLGPPVSHAGDARPLLLRNQNPFLQIYGVPAPEGGRLAAPGRLETRLAVAFTNSADRDDTESEAVVLDGETYIVEAGFRYRPADRWEVGLDLPYVSHRSGVLDNLIEGWHDFFGLDNSQRSGPSNHLQLSYHRRAEALFDLRRSGGGIGDVRLTSAYRLLAAREGDGWLALRTSLKLPTGDPQRLRGSGAADLALSLDATGYRTLAGRPVALFAQAGAALLGAGDVLAGQQRTVVPFGSLGLTWRWRDGLDLRLQLAAEGRYFDSHLDPVGETTTNLALGGTLRLRRLGLNLDLALVEDLISDATPDFGLHFALRPLASL